VVRVVVPRAAFAEESVAARRGTAFVGACAMAGVYGSEEHIAVAIASTSVEVVSRVCMCGI
jgi:hypothetical protein